MRPQPLPPFGTLPSPAVQSATETILLTSSGPGAVRLRSHQTVTQPLSPAAVRLYEDPTSLLGESGPTRPAYDDYVNPVARPAISHVPIESFPAELQELSRRLMQRTRNSAINAEHGGIAVQIGDGPILVYDKEISSNRPTTIKDEDIRIAYEEMSRRAAHSTASRTAKLRIFTLHTHPKTRQRDYAPVFIDDAGRPYTKLSKADVKHVTEAPFTTLVSRLRQAGFTGPIEIVMGAIPVRVRGSANEPEIEQQHLMPYIATYRPQRQNYL